jgi:protein O-GlcNAc transferase
MPKSIAPARAMHGARSTPGDTDICHTFVVVRAITGLAFTSLQCRIATLEGPDAGGTLGDARPMNANTSDLGGVPRSPAPGPDAPVADSAERHYELGRSLILTGDLRGGWVHLQRAMALRPGFALPRVLWGQLLLQRGQAADALESFTRAAEADPQCAEAHISLGTTLVLAGAARRAVPSYDAAIAVAPGEFRAHLLRGWALRQCDRLDEAVASLETALRLRPDVPQSLSEALFCYAWICDWDGVERMSQALRRIPGALQSVEPSTLIAFSDDPLEQLVAARTQAARIAGNSRPLPPPRRYDHGRIRIAYVSRDFFAHATSFLMAELFELHDRSQFAILGVSFIKDDGSGVRRRIAQACDEFVTLQDEPDHEIARWLREREVDIAVDLKGLTGFARPGIFALRPAPIQVSYLGHPGSLGASFIDYLIADEFLIPPASQAFYAEKIAYLPDSYQVNDRKRGVSPQLPTRAEAGLPANGVVFCCFNNNWKITAPVFDVWMRLLTVVEGSVLWLLADNRWAVENLRRAAQARGVAPDRLIFAERLPNDEHLARHGLADLFLDTLPCNAHTTASDALWSGVPIVTCAGRSFPARVAGSLLQAVGLTDLVTNSLEEYEALALALARDRQRLASLHAQLSHERLRLPLFDTPRFCGHLEQAYRHMWRTHREGRPASTFHVSRLETRAVAP